MSTPSQFILVKVKPSCIIHAEPIKETLYVVYPFIWKTSTWPTPLKSRISSFALLQSPKLFPRGSLSRGVVNIRFYSCVFVMQNYFIKASIPLLVSWIRWSYDSLKHIRIKFFTFLLLNKFLKVGVNLVCLYHCVCFFPRRSQKTLNNKNNRGPFATKEVQWLGCDLLQFTNLFLNWSIFCGKTLNFLEGNIFENSTKL